MGSNPPNLMGSNPPNPHFWWVQILQIPIFDGFKSSKSPFLMGSNPPNPHFWWVQILQITIFDGFKSSKSPKKTEEPETPHCARCPLEVFRSCAWPTRWWSSIRRWLRMPGRRPLEDRRHGIIYYIYMYIIYIIYIWYYILYIYDIIYYIYMMYWYIANNMRYDDMGLQMRYYPLWPWNNRDG